ncbi:hypothetical protein GALL_546030 [mine drainage metagenome]|uniref:Uncharacterized protein n=1 Tax=mine drainage metagenome TaxID=410659 RepID=A0A1J5NYI3_9ZZZZ
MPVQRQLMMAVIELMCCGESGQAVLLIGAPAYARQPGKCSQMAYRLLNKRLGIRLVLGELRQLSDPLFERQPDGKQIAG